MFDSLKPPKEAPDEKPERIIILNTVKASTLEELDLDKELLDQYKDAKNLLAESNGDEEIPLNQKAQILNSITGIIVQIVKTQTDLYNAERVKKMEQILIETLKKYPKLSKEFLDEYEKALNVQ